MSVKLKQIDDPEKVEKKKEEMPSKFHVRGIEAQEKKKDKSGKDVITKVKVSEDSLNLAKKETVKGFSQEVKAQEIFDRVLEGIEQKVARKLYYVGKDKNQLFCGPVLQIIPVGAFTQITSGLSTYSIKTIDEKKIKFEKSRQLMIRVGKKVGKDFVVVVGRNGCVIIEAFASAVFNMPVYIVEPNGNFYFLNHGRRVLYLDHGNHLVLYTKEAPIIFAPIKKSEKVDDPVQSKIDSIKSNISAQISLSDPKTQSKPKPEEKKKGESVTTLMSSEVKAENKEKTKKEKESKTTAKPVEPEKPVGPGKPLAPQKPVEPEKPVGPEKPLAPQKPVEPQKPAEPEKSEEKGPQMQTQVQKPVELLPEATPTEPEAQPAEPEVKQAKAEVQPAESEAKQAKPETQPAEPEAKQAKAEAQPTEPEARQAKPEAQRAEGVSQPTEPEARQAKPEAQRAEGVAQPTEPEARQTKAVAQPEAQPEPQAQPQMPNAQIPNPRIQILLGLVIIAALVCTVGLLSFVSH